jgi:hypothetical protein
VSILVEPSTTAVLTAPHRSTKAASLLLSLGCAAVMPDQNSRLLVVQNRPGLARVDWGAMWAGLVVTAGLAILLSLLVVALGVSIVGIDEVAPWQSVASGTAIVVPFAVLFAIYVGAWLTARLTAPSKRRGMLCGAIFWSLCLTGCMLFTIWVPRAVQRLGLWQPDGFPAALHLATLCFAAAALAICLFAGSAGGSANARKPKAASVASIEAEAA